MRRRTHKMGVGPGRIVIYIAVVAIMWLAGHIYNKYIEPNKEFIEQISGGLSDAMTQEASLVSGFSAVATPSQNESSPNIESQNESAELPHIKTIVSAKGGPSYQPLPNRSNYLPPTTSTSRDDATIRYATAANTIVPYGSQHHCTVATRAM